MVLIAGGGFGICAEHVRQYCIQGANPNQPDAGYGLVLAITADIAALFDAEVHLHQGADGRGLRAVVSFPPIR